jgi:hypothetical protein
MTANTANTAITCLPRRDKHSVWTRTLVLDATTFKTMPDYDSSLSPSAHKSAYMLSAMENQFLYLCLMSQGVFAEISQNCISFSKGVNIL